MQCSFKRHSKDNEMAISVIFLSFERLLFSDIVYFQ